MLPPLQLWPLCHPLQAALHFSVKRGGRPQQLSPLQMAAMVASGRQHLHPTTRLVLLECTIFHKFSGHAKLCFITDKKSNKDFLVDTGATLSLVPFQSAAAAIGPKLQAENKQAIKTWNFMNSAVKFNGQEYTFAFLRADVPFPIVGLDFVRFFGMQVNPSYPVILIAPPSSSQGGGTAGYRSFNAPSSCFLVQKEAPVPQPKFAAGAHPSHPRISPPAQAWCGTSYPHRW
jgi:predicted aspartyl protease